MHARRMFVYGMMVFMMLSACSRESTAESPPDIQPRILQVEPEQPSCPVGIGQWMAFTGRNFGQAEDWQKGANQLIFFDQVAATQVTLVREDDPATLFVTVPEGAQSGPVIVRVQGRDSSAFHVTIADPEAIRPQLAVPVCTEVTPP